MPSKNKSGFVMVPHNHFETVEYLEDKPFKKYKAKADLLHLASFKDGYMVHRGLKIKIGVGGIPFTMRDIADRWGWSPNKVIRFIDILEEDGFLKIKKAEILDVNKKRSENGTRNGTRKHNKLKTITVTYKNNNSKTEHETTHKRNTNGTRDSEDTTKTNSLQSPNNVNNVNNIKERYIYPENFSGDVKELFSYFINARKQNHGYETTDTELKIFINQIQKYSNGNDEKAIDLLQQAIISRMYSFDPIIKKHSDKILSDYPNDYTNKKNVSSEDDCEKQQNSITDYTNDYPNDYPVNSPSINKNVINKNVNNNKNYPEKISGLIERYSNKELIENGLNEIRSTRKSNKISQSVELKILESWSKYTENQVYNGINIYISKEYSKKKLSGKGGNEKYLLGIIRNQPEQGGVKTNNGYHKDVARFNSNMEEARKSKENPITSMDIF